MKIEIGIEGNTTNPSVVVKIDHCKPIIGGKLINEFEHDPFRFIREEITGTLYVDAERIEEDLIFLLKEDGTVNNIGQHIQTVVGQLEKEIKTVKEEVVALGKMECEYNFEF